MTDPKIDQIINMLNAIGAEMGIEFPVPGEQPQEEMPMEEEMPMPNPEKERYLQAGPDKREEIDRKKVFGRK
jgi:hypothetical protein